MRKAAAIGVVAGVIWFLLVAILGQIEDGCEVLSVRHLLRQEALQFRNRTIWQAVFSFDEIDVVFVFHMLGI